MRGQRGAFVSGLRAVATTAHKVATASSVAVSPTAKAVQDVGDNPDLHEDVATTLGGPASDGVSADVSLEAGPSLLRGDELRHTAVLNARVVLVVQGEGTTGMPNAPISLLANIDQMMSNLYPVAPLDRAVRVYDKQFPLSSHTARTKKSPNRDLDLLEREWRLRHYDHFDSLLHPHHVTPAPDRLYVLYRKKPPDGDGRQFEFPERTVVDENGRYQPGGIMVDPPINLYRLGPDPVTRAFMEDAGAFATPRVGTEFELLFPEGGEPVAQHKLIDMDEAGVPLDLKRVRASIRRGSRSSTGPVDSFDPFTVYVGCRVSADREDDWPDEPETAKLHGSTLYRPCPLRMDVTSRREGSVVLPGDFTRGGKVMKRDVLAAVEDGLAGVVRLSEFYTHWNRGQLPGLSQELLSVRCAEWYSLEDYSLDENSPEDKRPLRVVVELARPGVPFASVSVFTLKYTDGWNVQTLVAHDDDQNPAQCLLRRRFFSTFSGLDTSRLPKPATVNRAYVQLQVAVDALLNTLGPARPREDGD